MSKNTDRIRDELARRFATAGQKGEREVVVLAKEIHDSVNFIPGSHPNQMPSVCNVMHDSKQAMDKVLHITPSGKSSTLKIAYRIPR